MYTCVKCSEFKPVLEFYIVDKIKLRYDTTCKKCRLAQKRKYHSKPEIKALRKEYHKEYHGKPEIKELRKKRAKEYRKTEKHKAHEAVSKLIRKLPHLKAEAFKCALCGDDARDLHHHSYKPENNFHVTPLCRNCHKYVHVNNINTKGISIWLT